MTSLGALSIAIGVAGWLFAVVALSLDAVVFAVLAGGLGLLVGVAGLFRGGGGQALALAVGGIVINGILVAMALGGA